MPDKKYLSAQEVQKEFGPSRHTLLRWESEGAVTPARVGTGQRRYDRDQITTLLKQSNGIKPPPIATVSPNGNRPRPDFLEYGVTGLNRFSGSLYEEKLRELRGRAGRIKFSEMRRNSPVVAAIFFGLVNALKQPSVRAKPASDSIPDQKAALWLETNLNDMSFSWMDTLDLVLQPLFEQGFTLLELVYKRRMGAEPPPYTESPSRSKYKDGTVGWRKWAPRPAESLADGQEWIYDAHGGIQGINQQPDTLGGLVQPLVNYPAFRDIEGTEQMRGVYSVPIEKLLHFRTTLHPANNPEGMSLLRPMYLAYHFATNLQEIEGIGAERDLAGIPVMYLGEGTTLSGPDSDYEEAKALVVNLRNDDQTGIVIPHPKMGTAGEGRGVLLELLSTGGRRNWDVGSIVERYEKRMALSCLAQFIMLGMQQVGSYALSRHQGDLFVLAASAFLQSVADVVNRHAIPRLFALNAFPGITGYPELVFSPVGIPDLEAVSDFVNKLVEREVLTPDPELERHLRQLGGLPAPVVEVTTSQEPEQKEARGVEETALLVRRLSMAIQPLQELMVLGEEDAQAMLKPLVEDLKRALGVSGATNGDGFEEAQTEAEEQMRGAIDEGDEIEAAANQYVALMKNWQGFRDALAIVKKNLTEEEREQLEKFNPNHDAKGRFTGPGGGGGSAAEAAPSSSGGGKKPAPRPAAGGGAASSGESEQKRLEGLMRGKLNVKDAASPLVQGQLADLGKVSPALLTKMSREDARVNIGDRPVTQLDSHQNLAGVQPRGWPPGQTWDKVGGLFDGNTGNITVGNGKSGSISTILHEYGHGVYHNIVSSSQKSRLQVVHASRFSKLSRYLQQGGPGHHAGTSEMWAEGFAAVHKNRAAAIKTYGKEFVDIVDAVSR